MRSPPPLCPPPTPPVHRRHRNELCSRERRGWRRWWRRDRRWGHEGHTRSPPHSRNADAENYKSAEIIPLMGFVAICKFPVSIGAQKPRSEWPNANNAAPSYVFCTEPGSRTTNAAKNGTPGAPKMENKKSSQTKGANGSHVIGAKTRS